MTQPGLNVRGGAAGVVACTEDIAAFSRAVAHSSTELLEATACLGFAATDPGLLVPAALDPPGAARAHTELLHSLATAGVLAAELTGLAGTVAVVAQAYELSEAEVADVLTACWHQVAEPFAAPLLAGATGVALAWVAGRAVGVAFEQTGVALVEVAAGADPEAAARAGLARVVTRLGDRLSGDGTQALEWLVHHPEIGREVLALLPMAVRAVPGDPLPADPQGVSASGAAGLAQLILAAGRPAGLFVDGRVSATAVEKGTREGPRGVADLLSGVTPLTAPRGSLAGSQGYAPGAVAVDSQIGADGVRRWTVYVPPTNDWGVDGGRYPSDMTSNLEMVAKQGLRPGGADPDAVEAALTAMRAAGVGAGEPVLVVGFSQGGITAATLASDPAIRSQYRVDGILTAGAPISEFDLPEGVAALSLENDSDPVPELDGARNPDRPNWATVERDVLDPEVGSPVIAGRVADGEPFAGHYLDGYLDLAHQVDDSSDPSVQAWLAAMGGFLAGGETQSTRITLRRHR